MEEDFDKDDMLGRWLGGNLSQEEEKALRKRPDFKEYEALVKGMEQFEPSTFDHEEQLARLKAKRKANANRGGVPRSTGARRDRGSDDVDAAAAGAKKGQGARVRRLSWLAAAATVLLVLSVWALWPAGPQTYLAAAGERETADLADGSTVQLNAGSSLSFTDDDDARAARLDGEGFFDVAKDGRTFTVETNQGTVTVLGTSFNVYARDDGFRVSCQTGKVRVTFNDSGAEHTLVADQSVSLTDTAVVNSTSVSAEALDWLSGRSVFNARPVGEVLDELERQFGLTIRTPPGFDRTRIINTAFPHGDADRALEIALGPLDGVRYNRNGEVVVLE